jgi:hypothetical protein
LRQRLISRGANVTGNLAAQSLEVTGGAKEAVRRVRLLQPLSLKSFRFGRKASDLADRAIGLDPRLHIPVSFSREVFPFYYEVYVFTTHVSNFVNGCAAWWATPAAQTHALIEVSSHSPAIWVVYPPMPIAFPKLEVPYVCCSVWFIQTSTPVIKAVFEVAFITLAVIK